MERGRERVESEKDDCLPRTGIAQANIRAIQDIIEDDIRVKVYEIAAQIK